MRVGDRIIVTRGTYKGHLGTITEVEDKHYYKIEFDIPIFTIRRIIKWWNNGDLKLINKKIETARESLMF